MGGVLVALLLLVRSLAAQVAGIDAHVARTMEAFEVPGVALAIVKDGAVVSAKGYGVKALGQPASVDARTLFGIASNTKAFTATALGMLVDEGRLRWDDPVTRYLPAFQMWDPWVTRELTVRDLLVHRSGLGLGAGDLLWWPPTTYTRAEIAKRLRAVPVARSFRSAYAYDNVLYLVAGDVIEAVSGQSWEDFISTRIVARLGMHDTIVRASGLPSGRNVATPHAPVEGRVVAVTPFTADNANPAAGISSNAEDMAKWMIVQLARGALADGARLFSERVARDLGSLVTPMPNPEPPAELQALRSNFRGYALGFEVRDYRGRKVLTHTGGLPGYVSRVVLLPELHLGVAVLTNQESGYAFNSIAWHVVDDYLGPPRTDWIGANQAVQSRDEQSSREAERKAEAARDRSSRPSLPLDRYAGTYADAWYGDIRIELAKGGSLTMAFSRTSSLVGTLEHWQHDTFVARWHDRELRADAFITFALTPDGTVAQATMRPVSPATDFSFDFQDLLLKPVRPSQP
jgi:CubicO group peptidase (beta-lactamase class C family)